MKLKILTILLLSFVGCDTEINTVRFINNSKETIDSVKVLGNQNCLPLTFLSISPKEIKVDNLKNCDDVSGDGSFQVELYYDNNRIHKGFGYFTNGMMIFNEARIEFTDRKNVIIDYD